MSTPASIDLDKLGQASRRSAIISGISLAIILASLGFGVYQLYTLQNQINTIKAEKTELTKELEETKAELEQKQTELNKAKEEAGKLIGILGYPVDKLRAIMDFGPSNETKGADRVEILKETLLANDELSKILNNPEDFRRRASVTIRYYVKEGDGESGLKAIKTLREKRKFKTDTHDTGGESDTPTNAIWPLSPNLTTEDIKLVAYTLTRAGIQIRYIGDYPTPDDLKGLKGQMIMIVGADRRYKDMPVWTVERIRSATSFK